MSKGFGFVGFSLSKQPPSKSKAAPLQKSPFIDFSKKKEEELEKKSEKINDEDTLDAFMASINEELQSNKPSEGPKARREEFEREDEIESFMKYHAEKIMEAEKKAAATGKKLEDIEYDSDDNPIIDKDRKAIEILPPLNHDEIEYDPFEKNFYKEHPDIQKLTPEQIKDHRKQLQIRVSWNGTIEPPPLALSFAHFQFDAILNKSIVDAGYTEPMPIQKQAVPVALSGRDIIAIAKTGSGKTCAFLWPMLIHIQGQPPITGKGEGPIGIIIAPTRELAKQIYLESKKFAKPYHFKVASLFGGLKNKKQQIQKLKKGQHIVVATPGRLIDIIKLKIIKVNRVTYLVLDEADKMFDMGFEPQVRSIVGQLNPKRQTLLFSATFKRPIEELARDILSDPVRITVGLFVGSANEDIKQVVNVFEKDEQKWPWLMSRIGNWVQEGSVLIFCTKKMAAEDLATKLNTQGFHAAAIHGDKTQPERTKIMFAFKHHNLPILVATDVASRGLDIKNIKTVLNWQCARDIDAHTHRIGRTGRAGETGVAYTLITKKESLFAGELLKNLQNAKQYVTPELQQLALKSRKYRREKSGGASRRFGKDKFAGIGYNPTEELDPHKGGGASQYVLGSSSFVRASPATSSLGNFISPKANHSHKDKEKDKVNNKAPQLNPDEEYDPFAATEDGSDSEESNEKENESEEDDVDHYPPAAEETVYDEEEEEYQPHTPTSSLTPQNKPNEGTAKSSTSTKSNPSLPPITKTSPSVKSSTSSTTNSSNNTNNTNTNNTNNTNTNANTNSNTNTNTNTTSTNSSNSTNNSSNNSTSTSNSNSKYTSVSNNVPPSGPLRGPVANPYITSSTRPSRAIQQHQLQETDPPIQRFSRGEVLRQAMMSSFRQSFTPASTNTLASTMRPSNPTPVVHSTPKPQAQTQPQPQSQQQSQQGQRSSRAYSDSDDSDSPRSHHSRRYRRSRSRSRSLSRSRSRSRSPERYHSSRKRNRSRDRYSYKR